MRLPKKISPCPIVTSNLEIRFDSNVPPDAVYGVLYSHVQDKNTKVENLPILQLPEQIRMTDNNLKYQPYYRITKENIALHIGPKVINLSCEKEYIGWAAFYPIIADHLSKIRDSRIISNISRFGLRYINFFDDDIFSKIKLSVNAENLPFMHNQTQIKTQVHHKKFDIMLQVANNATIKNSDKKILRGSILDIDVSISNPKYDILSSASDIITEAHEEEKIVFFSLLKEEFLSQLKPEY